MSVRPNLPKPYDANWGKSTTLKKFVTFRRAFNAKAPGLKYNQSVAPNQYAPRLPRAFQFAGQVILVYDASVITSRPQRS